MNNTDTTAFVATGTFSDGSSYVITDSVTWTTEDGNLVTISNAAATEGVATAVTASTTTNDIQAVDADTGIESNVVTLNLN